uniref:Lipocalin n=1 Tax=Rhipicephalus appendiculatus TaxID=34631 RepID=A0A131Z082_RHIAP
MALLLIIVILTCKVAHIADACADSKEAPRFCWGGQVLYQKYCPGFQNYSQYTCFGGSSLGCACKTLYRAMDGQCVPYDQCEAHANRDVDIRTGRHLKRVAEAPGETSKKMPVIPSNPVTVPGDSNYEEAARQLIKSPKVLELLMMSEDSYVHDPCLCLKSTWLADATEGAERTVDCYDYRKWLIVPHTIQNLEGKEKLMKITRDAEFTVENTGGRTKVYLQHATRVDGTSHTDSSIFRLMNEYEVLVAKTTCVTLTFGSPVDGKQQCMIWGIRAEGKVEENDCYNSSASVCDDMTSAVESRKSDPCHAYDEQDKRLTKKAQEEQGIKA